MIFSERPASCTVLRARTASPYVATRLGFRKPASMLQMLLYQGLAWWDNLTPGVLLTKILLPRGQDKTCVNTLQVRRADDLSLLASVCA